MYESVGIDIRTKSIVYSDSLNVDKAVALKKQCNDIGVKCEHVFIGNQFVGVDILCSRFLWNRNVPYQRLQDEEQWLHGEEQSAQHGGQTRSSRRQALRQDQ